MSELADIRRAPHEEQRYADTLRRALDLPERDQLVLYEEIRNSLAALGSGELEEVRELRDQREALSALRRVVEHLQLDLASQRQLTGQRFKEVAAELGLSWNAHRVGKAFESWNNAKVVLIGERLPRNLGSRRHRRVRDTPPARYETYAEGLRRWLATDPPDLTRVSYEEFRSVCNPQMGPGERPLVNFADHREQHQTALACPRAGGSRSRRLRGSLQALRAEGSSRAVV